MKTHASVFHEWLWTANEAEIREEYERQCSAYNSGHGYYNVNEINEMKLQLDLFKAYKEN